MKSIKNVKEKVTSFENLYASYLMARRNKRYKDEVLRFSANLEENLFEIQEELVNQTYKGGPYREFFIHEPVKRLIMAQEFKHRIIQWALYRVINPEFVKGYIEDSHACIKGRGQISAVKRLHYWLEQVGKIEKNSGTDSEGKPNKKFYFLKSDVSKFFYRVDHEVSLKLIGRKVNYDPWAMWLLDIIINSEYACFGLPPGKGPDEVPKEERLPDKGMAVGSLISQMNANVNMNVLDQFCKRDLRIHYYIRYMDDFVIISDSKQQLHEWENAIEAFINKELKLELSKKKTFIRPITLGIDFCGYKIYSTHIKLRKSTALRMKRNLKRIQKLYAAGEITLERAMQTVNSYNGLLCHCNSHNLRKAIFGEYSDKECVDGWFCLKRDSDKICDGIPEYEI